MKSCSKYSIKRQVIELETNSHLAGYIVNKNIRGLFLEGGIKGMLDVFIFILSMFYMLKKKPGKASQHVQIMF